VAVSIPDSILERFRADLTSLAVDGSVAVAVSGGPDSLALLLLSRAALGPGVIAATVDHGLRAEAADESRFVARLCKDIGVDHVILAVEVEERGEGVQAAARQARYDALACWCKSRNISNLFTAHHTDDQAETLLMRLGRGAGIGGLVGVRASRALSPALRLVRPLLGWRKAELAGIVTDAGIVARDDPSNRDDRYDRTAVRALLAETPLLDARRLAASAAHLAEAEDALAWAADRAFALSVTHFGDRFELDPADYPPEIMRRMLVRIFADFGTNPKGPALDRLAEQLRAGGTATLAGIKATPGARWCFQPAPPRRAAR